MSTERSYRGRHLGVLLFLSAAAAVACTPSLARYPEPGEPGPVVTSGGDTIPEGPARNAFMAGHDRGFALAEDVADAGFLRFIGGISGGFVAGVGIPLVIAAGPFGLPYAAGGVGLVAVSASVGPISPMPRVPESVTAEGRDYEDGYREGYVHGLVSQRKRAALSGAGVGAALGIIFLLSLTPYT